MPRHGNPNKALARRDHKNGSSIDELMVKYSKSRDTIYKWIRDPVQREINNNNNNIYNNNNPNSFSSLTSSSGIISEADQKIIERAILEITYNRGSKKDQLFKMIETIRKYYK